MPNKYTSEIKNNGQEIEQITSIYPFKIRLAALGRGTYLEPGSERGLSGRGKKAARSSKRLGQNVQKFSGQSTVDRARGHDVASLQQGKDSLKTVQLPSSSLFLALLAIKSLPVVLVVAVA